jgi:hypothetical protein
MYGYGYSLYNRTQFLGSGGGIDPSAQAFITAAVITDPTQITAINNLVVGMKADGIWTKMKAIYPFVGGTASTHKYNLKDPRDLDAAFRLVFNGGWTHSSNGATPNGTNGYADTKLNAIGNLTNNNMHISYYVRNYTLSVSGKVLIGSVDVTASTAVVLNWSSTAPFFYPTIQEYTFPAISTFPSVLKGLHIGRRINSTQEALFINATKYETTQASNNLIPNNTFYLGSNHTLVAQQYTDAQTAFSSIGDGLTDTEASNLYTRVQAYQTALSRQV